MNVDKRGTPKVAVKTVLYVCVHETQCDIMVVRMYICAVCVT